MSYKTVITGSDWTLIASGGPSGALWLDQDNDAALGSMDVRVRFGQTKPLEDDFTDSLRIYVPTKNNDVLTVAAQDFTTSLWAKCSKSGDSATVIFDANLGSKTVKLSGLHTEPDGALRTQLQDNQSELVGLKICRKLGDITLASNTTIDTRVITLTAGHGVVVGNILCLRQNSRFYQATVLIVATNTITLDTPLDYAFTTAAVGFRSSEDMNVDGSGTPIVFVVSPPAGTKWDIYGCSFNLQSTSAMDDSKFGSLTSLARGMVVRKKDGTYKNIFNIKNNSDFAFRCDEVKYADRAPAGSYGVSAKKTFSQRHGVVIRLDASNGDEFQVIIQDNLTGLSSMRAAIWGHVVS